jgi:pantoate kinase
MKRLGYGLSAVAALATLVAAEPQLHLAFEDRGDPRPRQMAVSAEIAGKVLAVIVSWTSRSGGFR